MSRMPAEPARRAGASTDRKSGGRPNSLGLEGKQLEAAIERIDGHHAPQPERRRRYFRWPFRQTSLDLRISQPGGSVGRCRVACRNISCGGMSVLHSSFIYPGSVCTVFLPRPDGRISSIPATIVRCVHQHGTIHEIGIKFDEKIAIGEFVSHDPLAGEFSLETVEPDALVGTVLHIEDSPLDQRLISHYLRATNLRVRTVDSAEQAGAAARDGCDIVLCDYHIGESGPDEAVRVVREVLPDVPIVLVTADSSPETLEGVRRLPVSAFLAKPFDDAMLLRALGEFLLLRPARRDGGSDSAHMSENPGAELGEFQRKLGAAVAEDDAMACYILCQQVGTAARTMRVTSLAHMAEKAFQSLATTMSVAQSRAAIDALVEACGKRAA